MYFFFLTHPVCCRKNTKLSSLFLQPDLLLDVHLHDHVASLYQKIRSKAIVQYFSPFISVDLNTMAAAFNTDVVGLEKELSGLIMEGSIEARIDSHNKVWPSFPPPPPLSSSHRNFYNCVDFVRANNQSKKFHL